MVALWYVGIDHNRGNLKTREIFARLITELTRNWQTGRPWQDIPPPAEWFFLKTCYRAELYGWSDPATSRLLRARIGTPVAASIEVKNDTAAIVHHLVMVAGGGHSPTVGEPHIMNQVRHAFKIQSEEGHIGPYLDRLLNLAIHGGRRIRRETGIQKGHTSVPSVTLNKIREFTRAQGGGERPAVFILGTGEMAQGIGHLLVKAGFHDLAVASRTKERAQACCDLIGGGRPVVWDFDVIPDILAAYPVVISATAAPYYMWSRESVATGIREGSTYLFIDIATPRDIDPEVADLSGVELVTVDDIRAIALAQNQARAEVIAAAGAIAAEVADHYVKWWANQKVAALIKDLVVQAEQLRRQELARHAAGDEPPPAELDAVTRQLTKKLLHSAITTIKRISH